MNDFDRSVAFSFGERVALLDKGEKFAFCGSNGSEKGVTVTSDFVVAYNFFTFLQLCRSILFYQFGINRF